MDRNIYHRIPFYSAKGTTCTCGKNVKISHWNMKHVLHSHGNRYNTGSREQEVTLFWHRDNNDWFRLECKGNRTGNSQNIYFKHLLTGKYIYLDNSHKSPTTRQRECSTRSRNNSNNFVWRVNIMRSWYGYDTNNLHVGDWVRFFNVGNGHTLHSHNAKNRVTRQYEVTGYWSRDSNDHWVIIECR